MMNSTLLSCFVVSFCHMIGKLIIFLVDTLNFLRHCTYSSFAELNFRESIEFVENYFSSFEN